MHSSLSLIATSLALTSAFTGPAPIVNNNPKGVTYTAVLPDSNTTTIRGYIAGTSNSNGTGVNFNVNFYGFPSTFPYLYHIHDQPVPSDGNCTKTLAHLDTTQRGEVPVCDPTQPATCQVGDLSGKHGKVMQTPFQQAYLDLYLSTASGPGSFFGNRSIVIHLADKTRLTCANFTLTGGDTVISANGTNGTISGGAQPAPSQFVNAATGKVANVLGAGAVAGLIALML